MKRYIILITIMILPVLISCTNSDSHHSQNTQTFDGGSDTGGSNDFMGKPIESYAIKDLSELSEYRYIEPILKKLEEKNPAFAEMLKDSIAKRTWYLVPGTLKHISNYTVAAPLSETTGQYALHSEKSVWISEQKRKETNNEADRALHILHEMIMAVKVDGNLRLRKITEREFITQTEYDEIRGLSVLLFHDIDSYSAEDLQSYLKQNHFFRAYEILDLVQLHPYETLPAGFLDFDSVEEFYSYSYGNRFIKSVTRYGYKPDPNKKPNYCKYNLETLKKLTVSTYDEDGAVLINTKEGYPDKWTGTGTIEFSQLVEYKKTKERLSVRFITDTYIEGNETKAHMAHMYYIKDDLLFLEMYKVRKLPPEEQSGPWAEWTHESISEWYILCVNGGLK